ncbi:MAG: response regulator [Burkholderiales bacterium]|nr:response regulator [Burkholderiales bacterium]MBK9345122.1 response regulator [Burkholderiales bacterium]
MIVDDSKVGRVKTNRFLLNQHFQSQMAEDGLDAVQKIAAQMPDIVITDVEMPGMDGFELTREIRRNPATAHLPVIIISGNDEGYAARAQEVGADLILGKPYSETDMAAHLHRFMQNGR